MWLQYSCLNDLIGDVLKLHENDFINGEITLEEISLNWFARKLSFMGGKKAFCIHTYYFLLFVCVCVCTRDANTCMVVYFES